MKKQSFILFTTLSKKDMTILTNEVSETIAFGLIEPRTRIFTAAELSNIQSRIKSRPQRRYL